jgi:hypothetical protein
MESLKVQVDLSTKEYVFPERGPISGDEKK